MKYLITGGAGFIGSHLAEKLLYAGHHVIAIDDLSTGTLKNIENLINNQNFTFVYDTIFNKMVIDRIVSDSDVVFHLAATVGVELIIKNQVQVIENNIHGTEVIIKACNRYRKKLIIASTSEVYGKNEKTPFSEKDDFLMGATINARWSYAATKAIDEFLGLAYYKEYNLPVTIVRLFNTVGPRQTGQYGMVIPRFIEQAMNNKNITVYGTGEQTRCFCHIDDVVTALIQVNSCTEAIGQIINIGNNDEISIFKLAKKIVMLTKSKSEIIIIPYDEAYENGFEDMMRRVPDITKIKKLTGFIPTKTLDTIIKDVHNYYINK